MVPGVLDINLAMNKIIFVFGRTAPCVMLCLCCNVKTRLGRHTPSNFLVQNQIFKKYKARHKNLAGRVFRSDKQNQISARVPLDRGVSEGRRLPWNPVHIAIVRKNLSFSPFSLSLSLSAHSLFSREKKERGNRDNENATVSNPSTTSPARQIIAFQLNTQLTQHHATTTNKGNYP